MRQVIAGVLVVCATLLVDAQGPTVRTLGVAGRSNEHVSAAALERTVALAWAATSEAGTDIYAAVSRDAGDTFSAPARVNNKAGEASVGGEQPPRVTLVPSASGVPQVVVVWTAKAAAGTRLLSARSVDGGRTFGAATIVAGSDAPGNRGWESIATDASGRTFALWLDHRRLASTAPAMSHDHGSAASTPAPDVTTSGSDPVERAGLSQLFFGAIDGSLAARALAAGVCYCCKTSLVTGADGGIYAVWRHVYPGNQRDIAFTMSRDGGRTFAAPIRVSRDGWAIDGCPENGPAVAVDRQGAVHVVWPTVVSDGGTQTLGLFYSTSRDGASFASRMRLPGATAGYHPQLLVEADGLVTVAWDEVTSGGRRIVVARGRKDAAGRMVFTRIPPIDARPGVYPVLARASRGAVLAWVRRAEGGSVIATARLPQ